jgi:hypothetical protein
MLLFWTELSVKHRWSYELLGGGPHYRKSVTARHQAAVEELDRKLKVVPIKTGGSVIVSSTAIHAKAQTRKFFGALNISYHCALTVQSSEILVAPAYECRLLYAEHESSTTRPSRDEGSP